MMGVRTGRVGNELDTGGLPVYGQQYGAQPVDEAPALQMSPASSDRNRRSAKGGSPGHTAMPLCSGLVTSIQGSGMAG